MSLRLRLTFGFLLVVLLTAFLSVLLGYRLIRDQVIGQAQNSILGHLRTSHYIYNDRLQRIQLFIDHLATLDALPQESKTVDREALRSRLLRAREELSLDLLNLTDATGRVLFRSARPEVYGDLQTHNRIIAEAIRTGESRAGSTLFSTRDLAREGPQLAKQASIEIVETKRARNTSQSHETRALALTAVSPILAEGRVVGTIYGAQVLNRNYEFVDRIQDLVFQGEQVRGREVGTATLFLDDVRISTNVLTRDGSRAIGTRVSREVYDRVVREGAVWQDEAFVVDRWYISAYEPIRNPWGEVIGILYVGILGDKFDEILRDSALSYAWIIVFSSGIAVLLALYFIRRLLAPYRELSQVSHEIAQGNYETKIDLESNDEIGLLAQDFNRMVEAIQERDRALKEDTQKKLDQSEKLASLGRLSAGIAHEVNNPLTGVLSYVGMLLEDLRGTEFEEDLRIIREETLRCRKIVRGILDFARETRMQFEPAHLNEVLEDTLGLLEKNVHFHNVTLRKQLADDLPRQDLDVHQIRSVINNLALNAADAMPEGGLLEVITRYHPEEGRTRMIFRDSGTGISEENLEKIFDPFFTTKAPGQGTGLGMSISYGIISRHGGTIRVESQVGRGTEVTVELPVMPESSAFESREETHPDRRESHG